MEKLRTPKKRPLNEEFRVLISLVCESIEAFRHYDLGRIAVSVSASRGEQKHGVWAYVVPLRHYGGGLERRGIRLGLPGFYRFASEDVDRHQPGAHYIMTFLVPKFFRLTPEERFETIVHEIYHLHPTLRGDLRRFEGAHRHHGPTPAQYKAQVRRYMEESRRHSPWLLEHPLLKGDGEGLAELPRRHFRIPRQVFRPALWGALLAALVFGAPRAEAREVTMKVAQPLRSAPAAEATASVQMSAGRKLRALKVSKDRAWVFVSDARVGGWVPRAALSLSATAKSQGQRNAPGGARPKPGEIVDPLAQGSGGAFDAVDEAADSTEVAPTPAPRRRSAPPRESAEEEDFGATPVARGPRQDVPQDAKKDPIVASKAGKLFEEASPLAVRYGIVEIGDVLHPQGRSKDGKWVKVRIDLTGEEGWYPLAWMRRNKVARLAAVPDSLWHASLAGGSGGLGYGALVAYSQNIWPEGREGRPFDRLEFEAGLGYLSGFKVESGAVTAQASFVEIEALGRFLASTGTGHLRGGPELGFAVALPLVNAPGLSDEVKAQVGLSGSPVFAGLAGVSVAYGLSASWQLRGSVRVRLGGGTSFVGLFGVAFGFR